MEPKTSFAGRDVINSYDFNNQELCHIMDTASSCFIPICRSK